MSGFKHIFRRLIRYWRMNLLLLAGLSFAAGLLASLPGFAVTTANAALVQSINNANEQAKNISVVGNSRKMTDTLLVRIESELGDLVDEHLEIRQIQVSTKVIKNEQIIPVDQDERIFINGILGWSVNRQSELLNLIDGEWPKAGAEPPPKKFFDPPTLQVGIAEETAADTGLKIGDIVVLGDGTKLKIVGLLEPKNIISPIWYQDVRPFKLWIIPGLNEDTHLVSFLLSRSDIELLGSDQVEWRYILNHELIKPEIANDIGLKLINTKNLAATYGVKFSSNLPDMLDAYLTNLYQVQVIVFLLGIQSFVFVVYCLIVLSYYANRQLENEVVVLVSRGASSRSVIQIFAIDRGLLALLAGIFIGPLLAILFLLIWSVASGEVVSTKLSLTGFLLSITGGFIGWLALILPIYSFSRHSLLDFQRQRARPETRTFWQKKYIDLFILILGGLAYWQLSSIEGAFFKTPQNSTIRDPLLLLGPTLLLIGLALVFLRLFPGLLNLIARISVRLRGIGIKLSLSRLARDPVQPSQIILLITVAVALTIFALGFKDSLSVAQRQVSRYVAGSDIRIFQWREEFDDIKALTGVIQATPVYREFIQLEGGEKIELIAVDADTFAGVTQYPEGMSNVTIQQIMRVIQPPAQSAHPDNGATQESQFGPNPYIRQPENESPIPAVFSYSSLSGGKGIGDTVVINIKYTPILFEVRGILADFPTAGNKYLIVDRTDLNEFIDLNLATDIRSREVWLKVSDEYAEILAGQFASNGQLIASSMEEWNKLSTNALGWGTQRTLIVNAVVLILLSVIGYLLMSYFSARQRLFEISVLRAEGLSPGQLVGMLTSESILVIFIGLIVGTIVGSGLLALMRIYLSQILRDVLPGLEVRVITVFPGSILSVYVILIIFFGVALLLLLLSLQRSGIQKTLRLGEE